MRDSIALSAAGGSAFFATMAYFLSNLHNETTLGFLLFWAILGAGLGVFEMILFREISGWLAGLLGGKADRQGLTSVFGGYWLTVGIFSVVSLFFGGYWPSRYLIGAGLVLGFFQAAFGTSRATGIPYEKALLAVGIVFVLLPLLVF